MQQVAEDLGIHVSTVSRAASGKYMQTHRGIFALKEFFTGGTASVDGNVESRESVKQKVKEIVSHEDRGEPALGRRHRRRACSRSTGSRSPGAR